jgi:hypothetical protein
MEGMQARDGEHILVADSPDAFSRAVTWLAEDDVLWQHLHTNGRALIEQTQSMRSIRRQLDELLPA